LKIVDLCINNLEYEDKGQSVEIKVKVEVEMLPQLSIHTVEKTHAKAFVKRLTDGKRLQNWKAEPIPFVFFFKVIALI